MANLLPNNVPNLQQTNSIVDSKGRPVDVFVRYLNDTFTNMREAINFVNDQQIQLDGVVASLSAAIDQIILLIDQQNATTDELATKAPIDNPTFTGTVSGITKAMVGLGNVDNTSDANKPISTAAQAAIDNKLSLAGGNMTSDLQMNGQTIILNNGMLQLKAYTFAALPAASQAGRLAMVTDASSPSWNTAVAGGGSSKVMVMDDGTNWIVR